MAENFTFPSYVLVILMAITHLISTLGKSTAKAWTTILPHKLTSLDLADRLLDDTESIKTASSDYGNIIKHSPVAVLHPSSINDIAYLLKFAHDTSSFASASASFKVAARGQGHSTRGQAMADNGVVVDMASLRKQNNNNNNHDDDDGVGIRVNWETSIGFYADVGGEQLWVDVLHKTVQHGLAPYSWTDYLYLTVGGTLSNAGISGQTFRYGPQIANVYEMDVITGKGDIVTCSSQKNSELFYAVLGGLGQFGIITRARIGLGPAPKGVKWVRLLYHDFDAFTRDQEKLISINGLDYLEGLLLMHQGPPDNWRSSFFPLSEHPRIISLVSKHRIIYCIEIAKYYDDSSQHSVDKDLQVLLQGLSNIPGFVYKKNVPYVEFLNRVRSGELKLKSQGLWDVPHPWLNLFVPKSRISDFDSGVFKDIVLKRNITIGPVLVYPMNRSKWDDRMSAVVPEEEVFYAVGFLHSSGIDEWESYDVQNKEIMEYCDKAGIRVKQYLPHYRREEDWKSHFGIKWKSFRERKSKFDPRMILSPGQRIFNCNYS